jgi:hypothetical protein
VFLASAIVAGAVTAARFSQVREFSHTFGPPWDDPKMLAFTGLEQPTARLLPDGQVEITTGATPFDRTADRMYSYWLEITRRRPGPVTLLMRKVYAPFAVAKGTYGDAAFRQLLTLDRGQFIVFVGLLRHDDGRLVGGSSTVLDVP